MTLTVNDIREQSRKRRERQERQDAIEEKALGLMPDELLPDGVTCHAVRADAMLTYNVETRADAFEVIKKFEGFGMIPLDLVRVRKGSVDFSTKERMVKIPEGSNPEITELAPVLWHGRAWSHGSNATSIDFFVKNDDMLLRIKCKTSRDGFSAYCEEENPCKRRREHWTVSGVPEGLRTNYAGVDDMPGQIVVAWPFGADVKEALGVQ